MIEGIPGWAIALDYILGMIMWTLIFAPITPGFLVPAMIPLYVAWFFYMARFYVMPWMLGYSVLGMLSFPLEGEIARGINHLFGLIVN
jgi:hypothetical protein